MRFSLREEDTNEYISLYQNFLEEVQQLNKRVNDELNDVLQTTKYDKLQIKISEIIDAYSEVVIGDIENGLFSKWTSSSGSLRMCMKTYRAGDSADVVCAQIEQNMADLMYDTLRIEKKDAIITDRPIVKEDDLLRIEDICKFALNEIRNIQSDYVGKLLIKNDENEIFGTLRPLFEGIASNLEAFFEASLNSFVELHEFVKNISVQTRVNGEEKNKNSTTDGGLREEINGKSNNKIAKVTSVFISGNGFDISHNIDSSYWCFRDYLFKKLDQSRINNAIDCFKRKAFSEIVDSIMNSGMTGQECLEFIFAIVESDVNPLTWGNFEESLNFKTIFMEIISYLEGGEILGTKLVCPMIIGEDNELHFLDDRSDAAVRNIIYKLEETIETAVIEIKKQFAMWVRDTFSKSIKSKEEYEKTLSNDEEKEKYKKKCDMFEKLKKQGCIFATFNYTSTLEKLYKVNDVLYIHGKADDNGDELIVGFGEEKLIDDYVEWIKNEKDIDIVDRTNSFYYKGTWIECIDNYNPFVSELKINIQPYNGTNPFMKRAFNKDNKDEKIYEFSVDNLSGFGEVLNILRKKNEKIISSCSLFDAGKLSDINEIYLYGVGVWSPDYPYIMKLFKETRTEEVVVYLSDYTYKHDMEVRERISKCASDVGKTIRYKNMEC